MVETARYNSDGSITAVINGQEINVPDHPENRHRQMVAAWEAQGGTIQQAAQPSPEEAKAALLSSYKAAFDAHLDAVAQERHYDNRLTIVSYLGSTNPQWNAEAEAFIPWRDAALTYMFAQLAAVEAGEIQPPSIEDFIAGIAPIEWPTE